MIRSEEMKTTIIKRKLFLFLLAACMLLPLVQTAVSADINYIPKVQVSYKHINYKAGDAPQAAAQVTEGNCTIAYEYWREIYQKEAGGVWSGTGCYWYSDSSKMDSLAADKRITHFEAGKHYSYNIVLASDRGYFFGDTQTTVSVGDYEWGTPGRHTNLDIKEMSTKLYIYSPYSIDIPGGGSTSDKVITAVTVINVNTNLNPEKNVSFTARAAAACADQFYVSEEAWEAGGSVDDIIKSTDTPRALIAGTEYWYSIVLTAKDEYVFSQDFSDGKGRIKDGSGVSFSLGGELYDYCFHVSDNGKTLTAWEFMDPVSVNASVDKTIGAAAISGVKFGYKPGDAPQSSAKADSEKYEIEYECWEEMKKTESGEMQPVAFWYSDAAKNNALAQDKRITAFKEGRTYMYSVMLKAKNGYSFKDNCTVTVNGGKVNSANAIKTESGLFVTAVKTLIPSDSVTQKEIEHVEINDVKVDFNDGDTPTFGGTVPTDAKYTLVYEAWITDGAGITSDDSFNDSDHNTLWSGSLITVFDGEKTYKYALCIKITDEAIAEGWVFGDDTKLMINGREVTFTRTASEDDTVLTVTTDLVMAHGSSDISEPSADPVESVPISNTESAAVENTTDNTETAGGNSVIWIVITAAAVCAIAAAVIIVIKKKKNFAN